MFLGGAFIQKRARLIQSLVFFLFSKKQSRRDEIFVQSVHSTKRIPIAKGPPLSFYFLHVTYKTG